jgi:hypothetical protein
MTSAPRSAALNGTSSDGSLQRSPNTKVCGLAFTRDLRNRSPLDEDTLLSEEFPPNRSDRASDIRKRYEADRERGVDAPLVEDLYLSDFVNIVARRKLFGQLSYDSRGKFESLFAPIIDLRNAAAHPVRSLVTSEAACQGLWDTLQKIDEALFALRAA